LVIGEGGLASAIIITVPIWVVGVVVGSLLRWKGETTSRVSGSNLLRFAPRVSWLFNLFAWFLTAIFAGVPVVSLVLKASAGGFWQQIAIVLRANAMVLLTSLLWAGVTGGLLAALARRACWLAVRSIWFSRFLFLVGVVVILTPGPLIGLGLKDLIRWLVDREADLFTWIGLQPTYTPIGSLFYFQPSPCPVIWASSVRLFPIACLMIWPSLRAIPRELWETATMDGLGARREWRLVAGPLTNRAFFRAVIAVAALALGEVSASKLVTTPGYETYILRLFAQMHYGTESTVAALCLVQIAVSTAFAALFGWASRSRRFL
jgi:iron(III) transport system permease protein